MRSLLILMTWLGLVIVLERGPPQVTQGESQVVIGAVAHPGSRGRSRFFSPSCAIALTAA